jgi:hypothetical protein
LAAFPEGGKAFEEFRNEGGIAMNLSRRLGIAFLGTALVAAVVEIAAPKAVHAVTSLLVTVTNTYTNPVQNRDVDNLTGAPFRPA